jgi:hypothetical protein
MSQFINTMKYKMIGSNTATRMQKGHARRPLTRSPPTLTTTTTQEGLLLANIVGHNVLNAATVVLAVSHEVQSGPSALLLRTLDDLHTVDIGTEDLNRHLDSHTGKLVPQQERCLDSAQLDAQNDSVERISVLERHSDDVAGPDTARVAAVVEHCLALALGVEDCQL